MAVTRKIKLNAITEPDYIVIICIPCRWVNGGHPSQGILEIEKENEKMADLCSTRDHCRW